MQQSDENPMRRPKRTVTEPTTADHTVTSPSQKISFCKTKLLSIFFFFYKDFATLSKKFLVFVLFLGLFLKSCACLFRCLDVLVSTLFTVTNVFNTFLKHLYKHLIFI